MNPPKSKGAIPPETGALSPELAARFDENTEEELLIIGVMLGGAIDDEPKSFCGSEEGIDKAGAVPKREEIAIV